ncbi:uncharacterized protein LOC121449082 [Microtus oregoni]|uniref:uncharacterized protein LOC121449082 n=1 Tax=Microtus oregoni TaxID=111838 RepID=UPI001BB0F85F|nr:uncharacterized protein LOC121449082 [Microtus oregoni]
MEFFPCVRLCPALSSSFDTCSQGYLMIQLPFPSPMYRWSGRRWRKSRPTIKQQTHHPYHLQLPLHLSPLCLHLLYLQMHSERFVTQRASQEVNECTVFGKLHAPLPSHSILLRPHLNIANCYPPQPISASLSSPSSLHILYFHFPFISSHPSPPPPSHSLRTSHSDFPKQEEAIVTLRMITCVNMSMKPAALGDTWNPTLRRLKQKTVNLRST